MELSRTRRFALGFVAVLSALLLLSVSAWLGLVVGLVGLATLVLYYRK